MRPPCGFKSTHHKSLSTRFLLADCLRRGQGIGPKMQRVPEVLLQAAPAGFCTQDHPHCLAFRGLGSRHGGTIQDGTRWLNSLTCHGGQVHQVIEAKPIKKLNGPTAVTFISDITIRYGIPHSIIADNDTNFAKGALARFCVTQCIQLDLASVAHPQSNGQVE